MKTILINLYRNSLFRNSLYPMLATAVMAGFGFLFWLFASHLFSTEDVGIAATLISVMSMVSILSLAGFDTAIIRFLEHAKDQNDSLNTSIWAVSIASVVVSFPFLVFVDFISPQLSFLQDSLLMSFLFVLFCILSSLNILTDAIFLALRQTKFTFIIDTIFSIAKVALPFAFIPWGAFGIFVAAGVAQTLGLILSVVVLMRTFDYRPQFTIHKSVMEKVWKYSAGNYTADIFNFLPTTILPIIIVNRLGAEQSAYFFIVMMIVGLLYVIPTSVTRSLFAEGSYDKESIPQNIKRTLKTILFLLAPAMLVLIVGGELLLTLFGADYSAGGLGFLYIMTLTSVIVSVFSLYGSLFRLTQNVRALIIRNSIYAASVLGFTYLFLPYGLLGVGAAFTVGGILGIVASYVLYRTYLLNVSHNQLDTPIDVPINTSPSLLRRIKSRLDELYIMPLKSICSCKIALLRAVIKNGFQRTTILFYPEKPITYHAIYKICHLLGCKIVSRYSDTVDLVIHWEDTTYRQDNDFLRKIGETKKVINANCTDISKKKVGKVFTEVYGYSIDVDPRTYRGTCVKKSDINALHDGDLVECPIEPEEGYVYQKLIRSAQTNNMVLDLRIPIFKNTIPHVVYRYKLLSDRFNETRKTKLVATDKTLSAEEQSTMLRYCRAMGLDYGELDVLRSMEDNRLYIVDVNNTPYGPMGPVYGSKVDLERWRREMCNAFTSEFLQAS